MVETDARPPIVGIDFMAAHATRLGGGRSRGPCHRPGGRSGTAGALVYDDDATPYVLGNSHVFAPTVDARSGDRIALPGGWIGELAHWNEIQFYGGDDPDKANGVDAAIVEVDRDSWPDDFAPRDDDFVPTGQALSETDIAVLMYLGIPVRVTKYGATSDRTFGEVECINVRFDVGRARFNGQIMITTPSPNRAQGQAPGVFAEPGDSGSLVVSNVSVSIGTGSPLSLDSAPAGLLFAANGDGSVVFANPIERVLSYLRVWMPDLLARRQKAESK